MKKIILQRTFISKIQQGQFIITNLERDFLIKENIFTQNEAIAITEKIHSAVLKMQFTLILLKMVGKSRTGENPRNKSEGNSTVACIINK